MAIARFTQMLEKSGVYADQHFMIVPERGFNLVCLRHGRDYSIHADRRLDVKEVSSNQVDSIANEYVDKRAVGQGRAEMLLRLQTSMYGATAPAARAKLLKVSAKGRGIPVIKAKHSHDEVSLDVAILPR